MSKVNRCKECRKVTSYSLCTPCTRRDNLSRIAPGTPVNKVYVGGRENVLYPCAEGVKHYLITD